MVLIARAVVLPVVLALGLTGCTVQQTALKATNPNYVVTVGIAEPRHLIPANTTDAAGAEVLNALFTPLVTYDAAHRPVEAAAEAVSTKDNRTWTITLRAGWTFHNGTPVTADSYVDAWNAGAYGPNGMEGNHFFDRILGYAALNPATGIPRTRTLTGLKRLDDLTFQVTLTEPYADFKAMLGYPAFLPLPKDADESRLVGQGPFALKGPWQRGQPIETTRYGGYAGPGGPKIAGLTFRPYADKAAELVDLKAGRLDVVTGAPGSEAGVRTAPGTSFQALAFPTYDPRFARLEVRQAISQAIDRDALAKLTGNAPAYAFTSPLAPGFRANTCEQACAYDPAKARAQYEAAGGAPKLEISYNVDGGHQPWVDALCEQLRINLSVDCTGNPTTTLAELLTRVDEKQPVGVLRLGWNLDYPALENYLTPLYTTNGSANWYGYSDVDFDKLVADGDRAQTPDAAITSYQQAEDVLARDLPVAPLWFGVTGYAYSPNVSGVALDLLGRLNLASLAAARQ